jgi:N-acetylmuramoyl-L-alanine amidase
MLMTSRRVVRTTLVVCNVALLLAISAFAFNGTRAENVLNIAPSEGGDVTEPLDQLSSADIALAAAKATGLSEIPAVINQADSVAVNSAIAPADTIVVAKPQAVASAFASGKDIKEYVVQGGDTVSSIASKFSVTSDSIMWSNDLRSNTVREGVKLVIPPTNGIVYTVKSGDTADSLAQKYRANKDQIIAVNDIELTGIQVGARIFIPNGQQPVVASSGAGYGFAFGTAPIYGFNGYIPGWCTWYVASKITVPTNWGNANTWDSGARAAGWTVSSKPVPGAIGQTDRGSQGHVGIVEAVSEDGTMIKYSDMNGLAGFNRVGYSDWVPVHSRFQNFIYR